MLKINSVKKSIGSLCKSLDYQVRLETLNITYNNFFDVFFNRDCLVSLVIECTRNLSIEILCYIYDFKYLKNITKNGLWDITSCFVSHDLILSDKLLELGTTTMR